MKEEILKCWKDITQGDAKQRNDALERLKELKKNSDDPSKFFNCFCLTLTEFIPFEELEENGDLAELFSFHLEE